MKKATKKRKKVKKQKKTWILLPFEAKITKSKRSEKFKAKKNVKKRKNLLEFRFALFRFEAKSTKVKRKEAKKEKWNFIVK